MNSKVNINNVQELLIIDSSVQEIEVILKGLNPFVRAIIVQQGESGIGQIIKAIG